MELILMRHGKAELRSDAKADFERELTSIGRKKIKQAARGLACSLYKGRDVQIWSSPSVRTVQTAEILRLAFGKKCKLNLADAIVDGKLSELQTEWQRTPALDVVIVVGHEPTMSEWTEKISGSALLFRPGSAASMQLAGPEHTIGTLAWFMRAGVMAGLAPLTRPQRRQRS
jgi:phosphohistidine phosphatase